MTKMKTKHASVQNKKEGFIYNRYLTFISLIGFDSKRERVRVLNAYHTQLTVRFIT